MTITPETLALWKRLADEACPGPWEIRYRELDNHEQAKIWAENYGWLITRGDLPRAYHDPSMAFIAAARTAVPALIDAYEKLQADYLSLKETGKKIIIDDQAKIDRLRKQLECAIKQRNEFALQGKFTVDVLDAEIEAIGKVEENKSD